MKGPILLATDGRAQSTGAFAAAACLAAGDRQRDKRAPKLDVRVVTICDSLPIVTPEAAVSLPIALTEGRRAEMRAAALAQVRYNVADASNWNVDVISGRPAPAIAVAAAESDASIVVMGIGMHQLIDRVFGTETALNVIQLSRVPVLAVPQNWIGIPRKVLVAVDFGPASLRAARTAMRVLAPGGSVCFAHVAPGAGLPDYDDGLAEVYQNSLDSEFDRFIAAIGVPDDVTVTRLPLYGDTAPALLSWAHTNSADMIVAGTHGSNAFARLVVGSVASKLVRGARCAVLVASAPRGHDDEADISCA